MCVVGNNLLCVSMVKIMNISVLCDNVIFLFGLTLPIRVDYELLFNMRTILLLSSSKQPVSFSFNLLVRVLQNITQSLQA